VSAPHAIELDRVEVIGPSGTSWIDERWERVRRLWAQTTFYLFDAESWR
jgi:hypothetical protein